MLLILGLTAFGQQSNTLYLLHDIPQSNLMNPAVQLECKWFVGIPVLSSVHASYSNTAFTYHDLANGEYWDLEQVLDQMHRVDLFGGESMLQAVSVGYKHKSYYFSFHISERAYMYQRIPRSSAELVIRGNSSYVGETARFNAFRSSGYYNREYAFGVSKAVDQFFTLGLRAKLLFGKANVSTGRSNMNLITGPNTFELQMEGDYTLNSSLPITIVQDPDGDITNILLDEINYAELLMNRRNPGISFDLGVIYSYDEKLTLSASLLDLGIMRWSTQLNKVSASGVFNYDELDTGTTTVSWDFFNEFMDSVYNSFDITVSQEPYVSFLPAQLFLGANYQLNDKLSLGTVNRNVLFRGKLHSSLTFQATTQLADKFLATLSWSYLNHSIKNLGAGIAYYGKGLQFHLVTDNFLGFFYPFDTRTINLRMGVNLMLGCPRDKKSKLQNESYGRMPGGGKCSWTERPGKRDRKMHRAARKQN
ncbi:MAG: DUF5723 family protein [Bacteroidota bacterium]